MRAALLVLFITSGCSGQALRPSHGPQVRVEMASARTVIRLQLRDHVLSVHGGTSRSTESRRFSLEDRQGKIIAAGISEQQFRKRYPQLFTAYRQALADKPLDARLGPDLQPTKTPP